MLAIIPYICLYCLLVNAGKTKIMGCKVNMGQGEDFGDHPCGVCRKRGREFVTTQSYAWNVLGGFTKDIVVFQES